jgi:transcription initiation factor TFIIB
MNNSLNDYFNELDLLKVDKEENKLRCCEIETNFSMENNMIICKECNNIISNIIEGPEWKNYKNINGVNTTRCGMPSNILLPNSSLGTTISQSRGNDKMNKVNMYQNWNSMPYKERSLYKVFIEIDNKCKKNNITIKVIETSKTIYQIVSSTKISRGSNRTGIIAACVFYGCKECDVPRSTKEIADIFNIDIKIMTKGCKNLTEILRLNPNYKKRFKYHKNINIENFIDRFCSRLNLNDKDVKNIYEISKLAEKNKLLNDNTPPSMASGCILLYVLNNNLPINKKEISDICKISEVTIVKCYKKLNDCEEIKLILK